MTPSQLRPPTLDTLRTYGMSQEMWYTMLDLQDGKCPVCDVEFTSDKRPVIDHEHVRGYKKMKAEDKVRYVRGLLHNYCNRRLVAKGMTTEKAYNIYVYLSDYDTRRNDDN